MGLLEWAFFADGASSRNDPAMFAISRIV
jgi:hypothetical protein